MDTNTPRANEYLVRTRTTLAFTPLHFLEIRNAFKLGIFRNLLTTTEATTAWKNLQKDLHDGRLTSTNVKWPSVFRLAARLSEQHSATHGTRSLDILHVAAAKTMRITDFVSFDARQRALALDVGMKVAP